jgi:hypothetical protein
MKSMRQMINLMEGVMAVPGVGENLEEKSTSEKQARFMAAAAHDPKFAKKVGMDQSVAKEFNKADTGTKQLSNAMKNKEECAMSSMEESHVDDGQMSNPAPAVDILAMEGGDEMSDLGSFGGDGPADEPGFNQGAVEEALAMFEQLLSSFVDPQEALDIVMSRCSEDGLGEDELACIHDAIMSQHGGEYDDEPGDNMTDVEADADTLASAGWGSDEDYGDFGGHEEFEEAFDLNNGYDDINDASGNDYFPSGAVSPVVKATGPSGARHGDNPEQKKMQVAEVHKELVYSYRSFLGESAKKKS